MLSGPDLFLIQNPPFLQRPNIHPAARRLVVSNSGSTVQIGQLLYDLPLIGKVLAYAAAAAGQVKV